MPLGGGGSIGNHIADDDVDELERTLFGENFGSNNTGGTSAPVDSAMTIDNSGSHDPRVNGNPTPVTDDAVRTPASNNDEVDMELDSSDDETNVNEPKQLEQVESVSSSTSGATPKISKPTARKPFPSSTQKNPEAGSSTSSSQTINSTTQTSSNSGSIAPLGSTIDEIGRHSSDELVRLRQSYVQGLPKLQGALRAEEKAGLQPFEDERAKLQEQLDKASDDAEKVRLQQLLEESARKRTTWKSQFATAATKRIQDHQRKHPYKELQTRVSLRGLCFYCCVAPARFRGTKCGHQFCQSCYDSLSLKKVPSGTGEISMKLCKVCRAPLDDYKPFKPPSTSASSSSVV